tara:strand:- start:41 stop:280 length:240 start_codon:yes stop_codon:yes gene_type:complete
MSKNMTTSERYEKILEKMGFQIEIESEDGVSDTWICNGTQSYHVMHRGGYNQVFICGNDFSKTFYWYADALEFIIDCEN